jgi:hypothetical protein
MKSEKSPHKNSDTRQFSEIFQKPELCGSMKIKITEGSLKYLRIRIPAVL